MEDQIRCFTCGVAVDGKIRRYLTYREDLYLSEQDALDKAQIVTTCCRMTAMGRTNVAERVNAVGTVETKKGIMVVKAPEGAEYPNSEPVRVSNKKAGPMVAKEAKRVDGKMSFDIFTSLKPGIEHIPERTALKTYSQLHAQKHGAERRAHVEEFARGKYFSLRRVKPDVGSVVVQRLAREVGPSLPECLSAVVDLTDPTTFKNPELFGVRFVDPPEVYIPIAPFSHDHIKAVYEEGSTFEKVLQDFADITTRPEEVLHRKLLQSKAILNYPDVLLDMFEARMKDVEEKNQFITLQQVWGHMRVRKASAARGGECSLEIIDPPIPGWLSSLGEVVRKIDRSIIQQTDTEGVFDMTSGTIQVFIPQTTVSKYAAYITTLGTAIKEREVTSASENLEDQIVLELDNGIVLTFDGLEIVTEIGEPSIESMERAIVRTVVHSRKQENIFMIVLKKKAEIFVLKVTDKLTVTEGGNQALKYDYPFVPTTE